MRWSLLDLNFKQDQVLTVGGTKFWTHTPNVCVCMCVEQMSLNMEPDEQYERTEVLSGCMKYLFHIYI